MTQVELQLTAAPAPKLKPENKPRPGLAGLEHDRAESARTSERGSGVGDSAAPLTIPEKVPEEILILCSLPQIVAGENLDPCRYWKVHGHIECGRNGRPSPCHAAPAPVCLRSSLPRHRCHKLRGLEALLHSHHDGSASSSQHGDFHGGADAFTAPQPHVIP